MDLTTIRTRFLEHMRSHGHVVVPSASLVPENDPTTLFTGSGMQPLIPYLLGKEHPSGTRLANSQKCFRSGDLEEVGDNRHTTFFEMLGNWSLGDYGVREQLPWFFEFLTDELGLDPERLYVTVYAGDETLGIPRDDDAVTVWCDLFRARGIEATAALLGSEEEGAARGMRAGERIFYYADKNWWSRAGAPHKMPTGEPGGPDSEVFYEFTDIAHDPRFGMHCHPNCDCGRFLEVGNSVFMRYRKGDGGSFGPLPKQNVDFGGGLERLVMAASNTPDIIAVCHMPIIAHVERVTGKQYGDNPEETRAFRIIADHMKAAVFLVGDGVLPSNTDQGYFVRRLIRRAVRYADMLGVHESGLAAVVAPVVTMYEAQYPILRERLEYITTAIADEEQKFRTTLGRGMREFEKAVRNATSAMSLSAYGDGVKAPQAQMPATLSAESVFTLITTYGFPRELIREIAEERGIAIDWGFVDTRMTEHQVLSRAGSEHKFKGGLADAGEVTTMYHTCTHLMLAALRANLGDHVHQAGSNITAERLRFDFTHADRVSSEVLRKVEDYVNTAIRLGCAVRTNSMDKDAAKASGVEGSFWEKYPDKVTVYEVVAPDQTVYSRELCGGPHVENTGDIHSTFRIVKEESSSAGVRRIKAVLV